MQKNFQDQPLYTLTVGEWINLQKSLLKEFTQSHSRETGDIKELLTIEEAAKYLKMSKATLYTMNCHRQIPFTKVSGKVYYRRSTLDQWLASGDRKTQAQLKREIREGR